MCLSLRGSIFWEKTCSNAVKMVLNKGLLVIFMLLCFSGFILGYCQPSLYTNLQGSIRSFGFNSPGTYGHNMSCTYNIRVSAGLRITLEFTTLSILGTMPNCTEDSVEVFVG